MSQSLARERASQQAKSLHRQGRLKRPRLSEDEKKVSAEAAKTQGRLNRLSNHPEFKHGALHAMERLGKSNQVVLELTPDMLDDDVRDYQISLDVKGRIHTDWGEFLL